VATWRMKRPEVRLASLGLEVVPDVEQCGRVGGGLAGGFEQAVAVDELGIGIFAHAARIAVNDVPHRGGGRRHAQHLVDLLLVLGNDDLRIGEADEVADLGVEPVLVEAEAFCAQGVGGNGGGDPVGARVADDGDGVALLDPKAAQRQRPQLGVLVELGPGERFPESEFLLPEGDVAAVPARVMAQQLGQRVVVLHVGKASGDHCEASVCNGVPMTPCSSPR
jgi:hypothetical protein